MGSPGHGQETCDAKLLFWCRWRRWRLWRVWVLLLLDRRKQRLQPSKHTACWCHPLTSMPFPSLGWGLRIFFFTGNFGFGASDVGTAWAGFASVVLLGAGTVGLEMAGLTLGLGILALGIVAGFGAGGAGGDLICSSAFLAGTCTKANRFTRQAFRTPALQLSFYA